jgi:hypothetical protein
MIDRLIAWLCGANPLAAGVHHGRLEASLQCSNHPAWP